MPLCLLLINKVASTSQNFLIGPTFYIDWWNLGIISAILWSYELYLPKTRCTIIPRFHRPMYVKKVRVKSEVILKVVEVFTFGTFRQTQVGEKFKFIVWIDRISLDCRSYESGLIILDIMNKICILLLMLW